MDERWRGRCSCCLMLSSYFVTDSVCCDMKGSRVVDEETKRGHSGRAVLILSVPALTIETKPDVC